MNKMEPIYKIIAYVLIGLLAGFIGYAVSVGYGEIIGWTAGIISCAGVIALLFVFGKREKKDEKRAQENFEKFKEKHSEDNREAQSEHFYKLREYRENYNPDKYKKHKTLYAELHTLTHGSFILSVFLLLLGVIIAFSSISSISAYSQSDYFYKLLYLVALLIVGLAILFGAISIMFGFKVYSFIRKAEKSGVSKIELERDFFDGKLFYGKDKKERTGKGVNIGRDYIIGLRILTGGLHFVPIRSISYAQRCVVNTKHYSNGSYSHLVIDYRLKLFLKNGSEIEYLMPDEYMLDLAIEELKSRL